ncbi:MAG TPA: fibronectin type III domain-containing protein, partial [Vicinamibacterales bacterium]|nr:fibronectin type III domain-containing protein [Vicinamibacterales bacterium]
MNLNHRFARALFTPVLLVALASPALAQTRPSAPARLAATAGQDGSVTLKWLDRSSNETGFRITRQPAFPDGVRVVNAGQTTFQDRPGTGRFTYRVASFNDAGTSSWTSAARANVSAPATNPPPSGGGGTDGGTITPNPPDWIRYGIPEIPTDLIGVPGTNQIVLSWWDHADNDVFTEIQKQTQVGQ